MLSLSISACLGAAAASAPYRTSAHPLLSTFVINHDLVHYSTAETLRLQFLSCERAPLNMRGHMHIANACPLLPSSAAVEKGESQSIGQTCSSSPAPIGLGWFLSRWVSVHVKPIYDMQAFFSRRRCKGSGDVFFLDSVGRSWCGWLHVVGVQWTGLHIVKTRRVFDGIIVQAVTAARSTSDSCSCSLFPLLGTF